MLQLTALSSLTHTVRHLLPDPLPYHSPSVRPHERSSCTVNDKRYLSDKMRTLYYVSQLQYVYGILAKVYKDYCLPQCEADYFSINLSTFRRHVLPSLPQQNCCTREVLFLQMLAKFLSRHTSGLSRKRWYLRSDLMVSYARTLRSSRKSLAGWWKSNAGAAVQAYL